MDFETLKKEFTTIDIKNNDQLARWLLKYKHLSVYDLAQVSNRTIWTIYHWRKKLNFKRNNRTLPKKGGVHVRIEVHIDVPENWDSKEWLSEKIKKYSISQIARAVGIRYQRIQRRLVKYGIPYRSLKEITASTNPCNNYDWCYYHYCTLRLTIAECAKRANISLYTFTNWLTNHKISVRTDTESRCNIDLELWVKELYCKLKTQPIVKKVIMHKTYMSVYYHSFNIADRLFFTNAKMPHKKRNMIRIRKETSAIVKVPKVYQEFELELDDIKGLYFQYCINRKDWSNANIIERRLAYHNFIALNFSHGWVWPKYPDYILKQAVYHLQTLDEKDYTNSEGFIFPKTRIQRHGKKIISHFFEGPEAISKTFTYYKLITKYLDHLTKKKTKSKISTENLLKIFYWNRKIHIRNPEIYCVLLKKLKINPHGLVLDLNPSFGTRAIACAINNLKYSTIPNASFTKALENGFGDFINLRYESYIDKSISLLLCDYDYNCPEIDQITKHMDKAFRTVVFVPNKYATFMTNNLRPSYKIKVKIRLHQPHDYWFIYNQTNTQQI